MSNHINSFILYGQPGIGKTFTTAQVMSDALWIVTRKSNLGGYNSWLEQNPEEAEKLDLKPIKAVIEVPRMIVDKATGAMLLNDVETVIRTYVQEYIRKVVNNETKVNGIVFDELSIFCDWVYARMAEKTKGFASWSKIAEWVAEMCDIATATGQHMAFLCHTKDPSTHEEGPLKGHVKYRGGPSMPSGKTVGAVCASVDAVLHLDLETTATGEKRRIIRTDVDSLWERKCRVNGTPAVIGPDLRPLLSKAGWNFNQQVKE
jgi:hypothetical protein